MRSLQRIRRILNKNINNTSKHLSGCSNELQEWTKWKKIIMTDVYFPVRRRGDHEEMDGIAGVFFSYSGCDGFAIFG